MKLSKKSIATLVIASAMATPAFAGKATGYITAVIAKQANDKIKFELNSNEVGDSCNSSGWFVFRTDKPGGDNLYQIILKAYELGRTVTVTSPGANPCDEEAGTLSVKAITMGVTKEDHRKPTKP